MAPLILPGYVGEILRMSDGNVNNNAFNWYRFVFNSLRVPLSKGEDQSSVTEFIMMSAKYPYPILIMRDGRRLFAGNEQRKGDGDFYDDDASISMEGLNNSAKIYFRPL